MVDEHLIGSEAQMGIIGLAHEKARNILEDIKRWEICVHQISADYGLPTLMCDTYPPIVML